jgi:3-oxoacyl-[acyl-carrier protein] reductase
MAAPAAREARWPLYPDLAGKTAVVTGGSRGLGAEACRALAANGVRVAVGGRDAGAIGDVVDELRAMGADAVAAPADCTSADALRRARDRAQAALGPIEIVLAFAGGGRRPQPISDIPLAEWRADVDGNLTATFLTIQTFLLDLTRQVAHGAAAHGVRANCLAPSTVLNERMRDLLSPEREAALRAQFPLGRLGEPADVANAALFLASDASGWITGITLDVAGGQVMR